LQKAAACRAEKVVEALGVVAVEAVDDGQCVPLNVVLGQQTYAVHNIVESAAATAVETITVVISARAVYRYAHEPAVVAEECAPLIVEQRAVGLYGIFDSASGAVLALQLDYAPVEILGAQQRLAAVPREYYLRRGLCVYIVADEKI